MKHQPVKIAPLDQRYTERLQRLPVGKPLTLTDNSRTQKAWYRAAARLGIKVTIRTTPEGTRLWRVK